MNPAEFFILYAISISKEITQINIISKINQVSSKFEITTQNYQNDKIHPVVKMHNVYFILIFDYRHSPIISDSSEISLLLRFSRLRDSSL